MSTLIDLGDYLEDLGIAVQAPNPNPNLFLGSSPDKPDTALVIYEYPGNAPDYSQHSMNPVAERPQIQVVARAIRYQDADALARAAWSALARVTNMKIRGTYYRSIRPNGSPGTLSRDSNDRTRVYFNASVEKEVSVAGIS